MPRKNPTANATLLHLWMHKHRMMLSELAAATGFKEFRISAVARGLQRPNDEMKVAIQEATMQWERDRNVPEDKIEGVKILDWFAPEQMARYAIRRGRT